jgi:hypothetical protein
MQQQRQQTGTMRWQRQSQVQDGMVLATRWAMAIQLLTQRQQQQQAVLAAPQRPWHTVPPSWLHSHSCCSIRSSTGRSTGRTWIWTLLLQQPRLAMPSHPPAS